MEGMPLDVREDEGPGGRTPSPDLRPGVRLMVGGGTNGRRSAGGGKEKWTGAAKSLNML